MCNYDHYLGRVHNRGRFTIQPHIIVHQQKFQLINTEYYRAKEESVILMSLVV